MASINGFASSVTGTTGSYNALEPKSGWRLFVCPRGIHVSSAGSASPIVADTAEAASRIAANQWFQIGTDVSSIRQCSAVEGNSFAYSGSALTVTAGNRVVVIGNTQPTVSGLSATYQPHTTIYSRDDDAATPVTNSMVTSDASGGYQFWALDNQYDVVVQDNNQACQDVMEDVIIGRPAGDLIPDTAYTRLVGNTAFPWGSIYHAGEILTGITGAAGVTYHGFDTTGGWTQGNLFGFALNNVTKVYGDTHGGIFQAWNLPTVFNPKSSKYGAKGDNSTDDTTAIQAALNEAGAVAGVAGTSGGLVFLPRGTYIVNSTLTIPTKVRLVGEGRNATVIKAGGSFTFNGTTDAMVRIGGASENAHGTWVEELSIDCNDVAGSIGVYSTRANEPSGLYRAHISRFVVYGAYFTTTNTANFSIRDCEFYCSNSATSATKGLWIEDSAGAMVIDRCTFNSYDGTAEAGTCLHLDHTGGHSPQVSNCHFETGDIGIRQTGNDAILISNTGHGNCGVLFVKDSTTVNTTILGLYSGGSPVGVSDTLTGFTSGGAILSAESNGIQSYIEVSSAIGNTWTVPNPVRFGSTASFSGTAIGSAYSILTSGTVLTLGAGNMFGLSTAPAGTTTVTSIASARNGQRIIFYGDKGTTTFTDGNNIKTDGATTAVAPNDIVEFACIGTTWCQVSTKLSL